MSWEGDENRKSQQLTSDLPRIVITMMANTSFEEREISLAGDLRAGEGGRVRIVGGFTL
jgi:hypothetical protein